MIQGEGAGPRHVLPLHLPETAVSRRLRDHCPGGEVEVGVGGELEARSVRPALPRIRPPGVLGGDTGTCAGPDDLRDLHDVGAPLGPGRRRGE